jgi:Flp pilus assembly protein TadB
MRLVAAICSGVFAYLAVGYATGYSPAPRRRHPRHPGRPTRAEWLAQAGARVSPGQFWATSLCAGGATFLVVAVLTGAPAVALGPGVAVGAWPRAYYHRRRQQVGTERIAAWPDALRTVAAGLAARQTLHEALAGYVGCWAGPRACRVARSGIVTDPAYVVRGISPRGARCRGIPSSSRAPRGW